MKKVFSVLALLSSISSLFAFPWVDDAFILVETETPQKIQHVIETDYSFKDFTRFAEEENLLMAALKASRANDVIDLLLKKARMSPDSKTKGGVTAFMYACQYETDIEAVENVLFYGAKDDSKKEARILTRDNDNLTAYDYARKNELISQEIISLLNAYASEPVAFAEEEPAQESPEEAEAPVETPVETQPEEPEPDLEFDEEQAPESEEPAEVKNTLLDLSSLSSPVLVPESIYLYDYANDKYAQLEIPAALVAAEEAAKHFIADANRRDSNGRTKLMLAAKKGDIAKIEDLLYSGAQIDAVDKDGWTALMYAARFQKDADVTKLLLYRGADRSIRNKYGITPLMLSAGFSENPDVVSILLDTYSPDSEEARQALAYGISNYNSPAVLQAFIDKQVPLNVPYDGKTPLMLACQLGKNTDVIDWLLVNGASKYQVEASSGKTAYDYAKENQKLPHNVTYWSLNPNS